MKFYGFEGPPFRVLSLFAGMSPPGSLRDHEHGTLAWPLVLRAFLAGL